MRLILSGWQRYSSKKDECGRNPLVVDSVAARIKLANVSTSVYDEQGAVDSIR